MSVLEHGQSFGRYRVGSYLGSGVSGECYEAVDTALLRKVTLKLIQPRLTLSASARRQFAREMQNIARFDHPYLAQVSQFGEIDGQLYIVRRYVSSGSILNDDGRLWYRAPFQVRDALRYGRQLAEALDAIHQQGYVHGSLTLSNILVLRAPGGELTSAFAPFLLADAGLANFVRRFGSPLIGPLPITTAPEQLGMRATSASDQYALAVIIYCWLAARPPFVGTADEIEYAKLTETIPSLASFNSTVTAEQEAILCRALAVYPEERYPSILAFADALSATLNEQLYEQSAYTPELSEGAQEAPEETPETVPHVPPDVFQPLPEPATDPLPQPAPSPLPAPAPEPLPHPTPEPLPVPAPEPLPEPVTEPLPEPAPEPLPAPAPEPLPVPEPASPSPQQTPPAPQMEQLRANVYFVITSPHSVEPYEISIKAADVTIGRAGSSDILLDFDTLVSRHHALLKRVEDDYVIYDRRSASGVFINGLKISDESGHILRHGDDIYIGNYRLKFFGSTVNEHNGAYEAGQAVSLL